MKPWESEESFVNRCIPFLIREGKHPNTSEGRKAAAGECYGIYRNKSEDENELIEIFKSSDIQSVRFAKSKFTRSEAISWAKSHGFKSSDVEETPNQYRLRQFDPNLCSRSGGIKEISSGVQAYICPIKGKKSESVGKDDFDYVVPKTIDELKEGHIVKYKDKIGRIVKVIGD